MRVCFVTKADESMASYRYRIAAPARFLTDKGHEVSVGAFSPCDVAVFSKHFHPPDELRSAKGSAKVVFDVCDHHFHSPLGGYYREVIGLADRVTCPTKALADAIGTEAGREAGVIPDPAEHPAREPVEKPFHLLWFGHPSNLRSLDGIDLPYPVEIVSSPVREGITPWSPEQMMKSFERASVTIIPLAPDARSMCKSPNRMIEAIQNGIFVVAHGSPSHDEFRPFAWVGDIPAGVEWARDNPGMALKCVLAGQRHVARHYSHQRIGELWESLLLETLSA